jgi:type IV secretory pathway VirB3-like protein
MWQELLFLIPKNLVYVFVAIIVFAFLAMLYITYTDRNMTEFLTYDRTKEVVVVDPLFASL